jgi:hypothetical protein
MEDSGRSRRFFQKNVPEAQFFVSLAIGPRQRPRFLLCSIYGKWQDVKQLCAFLRPWKLWTQNSVELAG